MILVPDFPPALRVGHNVGVLSQGSMNFYRVRFLEGLPAGAQSVIDLGAIAASTASTTGQTTKTVESVLQLDDNYLTQMRFLPLDDFTLQVWEQGGTARYWTRNLQAEINRFSAQRDPSAAKTEIFILGYNRDAQFVARNPQGKALTRSRLMVWGWKYVLQPLPSFDPSKDAFTWVPADGNIANTYSAASGV